jgi:hypothetical protein
MICAGTNITFPQFRHSVIPDEGFLNYRHKIFCKAMIKLKGAKHSVHRSKIQFLKVRVKPSPLPVPEPGCKPIYSSESSNKSSRVQQRGGSVR